MKETQHYFEE